MKKRCYVIAVIAQKGGVGKSTIALHLAVEAERQGHTAVVIDLDPQSSAGGWGDSREASGPTVASAHAPRLQAVIEKAEEEGATLVIIDTAPHAQSDALAAAKAADAILIPCRLGIFDLRAVAASVDIARMASPLTPKPAAIVLNACPTSGTRLADEAAEAVSSYGIEVAPVRLKQLVAYSYALVEGKAAVEFEPEGKAAADFSKFYSWVCRFAGVPETLTTVKPKRATKEKKSVATKEA
jgi:chromosome partitioning protein